MTTRTQPSRTSPDAGADHQMDAMGRLAEMLERMYHRAPAAPVQRVMFEAPIYEGKGDVELFVRQFNDVAQANEWPRAAALLHLRRALREGATDCGRSETVEGIFNALRARYGLTPREARGRLTAIRRDSKTSLQEHSAEIERLVEVAYADIPVDLRRSMAVDLFSSTIGNGYLQRHLLAVHTPTLDEAVKAGNEYLQVPVGYRQPSQKVHMLENGRKEEEADEEEEEETVLNTIQQVTEFDPMVEIMKVITTLTDKVETISQARRYARIPEPQVNDWCYECGEERHWDQDCMRSQAPQGFPPQQPRQQQPPPSDWDTPPMPFYPRAQPAGNAPRPQ